MGPFCMIWHTEIYQSDFRDRTTTKVTRSRPHNKANLEVCTYSNPALYRWVARALRVAMPGRDRLSRVTRAN